MLSIVAGALACSGSAVAAPTWLPLQRLGTSVEKRGDPQVAVTSSGAAVSVFERFDGSVHVIQAAVRRKALGPWTVKTISPPGGEAFNPQIALDAQARTVAVWQQFNGAQQEIRGITGRGTSWGQVKTLSGLGAFDARMAGNDAGLAVAAWQRFNGARFVIQAARNTGGSWAATQDLSDGGSENATGARVALDAAGDAVVVWQAELGGTTYARAAVSVAGGPWSAPITLSGPGATNPEVAVGGGEAFAVWQRAIGSDSAVEVTGWRVGSAPPPGRALSQPGQRADQPDVAVAANGRAIAAWRAFDGRNFVVTGAVRAPGAGFEAPRALAQPRADSVGPRVGVDTAGNGVVVWVRSDGTNDILQSATRLAGAGDWLPIVNLTPPGGDAFTPQVMLAGGRGIATFVRSSGSQWFWSVADYLVKPPPQGFVSRAYMAAFRNGPPASRLQGRRTQVWAYFVFLVKPEPGRAITVTWYANGKAVAVVGKPRATVVVSGVRASVLTKGIWRAVLRVRGVTVKQVSVRVG
jgi:hypothetical protein